MAARHRSLDSKSSPRGRGEIHAPTPSLTADDLFLFNEGSHVRLYEKLGAHLTFVDGIEGFHFAVWAPNASAVSVIGDFNRWNSDSSPLQPCGSSGIWQGFLAGIQHGSNYKFHIRSMLGGYAVSKADPFAFRAEAPPNTASITTDLGYSWNDSEWMATRGQRQKPDAPMSIYELHLGSWRRVPEDGNRFLTYREIAPLLVHHLKDLGFTHVEFLPLMEHPFYGSWGYQTTSYFAPTSRYGSPQDLMFLIDTLHQHGLGVILDWVPSHFPTDEHGLGYFDGSHLFEHADARKGFHPDWKSFIFNYGRNEVRSFLYSSALFWLDRYHVDGLRVDAVASMLYLDYSRRDGEWIPNRFGGHENLEAIDFLRRLNEEVYRAYPDVQTIAEESTSWPMVSAPTYLGGLGFGLKWDLGWMHDSLEYLELDPLFRRHHHRRITFRMLYAFAENFVLPLSHDEVVHGKRSLLNRMPGDRWQQLANLRLLLAWMYLQPGKKLLFMGAEFAQEREWNHDRSLDWDLLKRPEHTGVATWVRDLNRTYSSESALHSRDFESPGFAWLDCDDSEQSVVALVRYGVGSAPPVVAAFNFTPIPRFSYRLGMPNSGLWTEILNSDAAAYGGSGIGNLGEITTVAEPSHGRSYSAQLTLPPLGVVVFRRAQ